VKVLKPVEGKMQGCLHAGLAREVLPLRYELAVGFGAVTLTRNRKTIWSGDEAFAERPKTVRWAETQAAKDPTADWRLFFDAPLSSRLYRRQGRNRWVLVKQGNGFA